MDWWKDFFREDYFKQYDRHLTPERTAKEVRAIKKILHLKKGDKILDLGCGQGRIAIGLAKRGYNVIGLDYSRYMLDIAKGRADKEKVSVNFIQNDMRRINFKEEFDVVISWFTTFGYFSDKDNAQVMKKVSKALKENGKFLIDIVNFKEYYLKNRNTPTFTPKTWYDYKDFVVLENHEYDKRRSRDNCKRIFLTGNKRKEYNWSLRLYSSSEIKNMLSKSGFEITRVYGGHDLSEFTNKSRRIVIVAQKE